MTSKNRRPFSAEWDWYARGDATYTSDVYVGNENESWVPAHTYVNTKLGVESSRYTVEFWVRNLFGDDNATAAYRDIFFEA